MLQVQTGLTPQFTYSLLPSLEPQSYSSPIRGEKAKPGLKCSACNRVCFQGIIAS